MKVKELNGLARSWHKDGETKSAYELCARRLRNAIWGKLVARRVNEVDFSPAGSFSDF
jgi:hypothetical protein